MLRNLWLVFVLAFSLLAERSASEIDRILREARRTPTPGAPAPETIANSPASDEAPSADPSPAPPAADFDFIPPTQTPGYTLTPDGPIGPPEEWPAPPATATPAAYPAPTQTGPYP